MGWGAATRTAVLLACTSVLAGCLQHVHAFSSIKPLPEGHGPQPAKIGMLQTADRSAPPAFQICHIAQLHITVVADVQRFAADSTALR